MSEFVSNFDLFASAIVRLFGEIVENAEAGKLPGSELPSVELRKLLRQQGERYAICGIPLRSATRKSVPLVQELLGNSLEPLAPEALDNILPLYRGGHFKRARQRCR